MYGDENMQKKEKKKNKSEGEKQEVEEYTHVGHLQWLQSFNLKTPLSSPNKVQC